MNKFQLILKSSAICMVLFTSAEVHICAQSSTAPPIADVYSSSTKNARPASITSAYKTGDASVWTERILNRDGTMNWTEYANVATHAGGLAQRDYLLGPKYGYYHSTPETFPTLPFQGDADGWEGDPAKKQFLPSGGGRDEAGWYAQAGPLVFIADDPNSAGVISAGNAEQYTYNKSTPPSCYYNKLNWLDQVNWNGQPSNRYRSLVPPELAQPDWHSPKKPIAVATATGIAANQAIYVAFENGFIGTIPVDPIEWTYVNNGVGNHFDPIHNYTEAYTNGPNKSIFPSVQLPAGKTPMALAVTPCGEFVLAAIWDVVYHKGQLAVMAVQGRVRCSDAISNDWNSMMATGTWMYGFPNWPTTKGLKLLGFIDLPIAAPMAIKTGTNMGWQNSGRGETNVNVNTTALLNSQSECDTWYNSDPSVYPNYKVTAHAGYAIVASRSENKVVFVDLQPLLEYYRKMYFTTQALYNETKNVGHAEDQWPYTFDRTPVQKPVVAYTLDVQAPTTVATGLSKGQCGTGCGSCNPGWNPYSQWRTTSFGDQYAYVTTMDGKLLIYNVGGLNMEAAPAPPVLYKTVTIGKNPTSIENGNGGTYKNDIFINCRGDKSIYAFQPSGDLQYVLRDSRINDPVMAENSYNGRQGALRYFIHVVDFGGKDVLTYVYKQGFPESMKFGAASEPVPGFPLAYQQDEVP